MVRSGMCEEGKEGKLGEYEEKVWNRVLVIRNHEMGSWWYCIVDCIIS